MRTALLLLLAATLVGCAREARETAGHDHAEGDHDEARGPHGGRLLEADGLRLELLLAEDEGPPTFKAWRHDAAMKPMRPAMERLVVVLERLGGRRDTIGFRIDGDHFHGLEPIAEPHSFAATVTLEAGGRSHPWSFEQHEGRVELAPEAIGTAGIVAGTAGPGTIEVAVEAPGEVRLDAERVQQVRPRFPGLVRALEKRLGDAVRAGETLARIHSNESLAEYEIAASMAGTIVAQDATVGQAVDRETILYTVADLSSVWIDFPIYPQNVGAIRPGLPVRIRSGSGPPLSGRGTVRYVGPLLEQDTRVSYGRVVLDNRDRRWQPGLYVTVAVTLQRVAVPVAVPDDAIVRLAAGPAVCRVEGNSFEAQPVVTGRSDGAVTEIVDGLEPGVRIVVKNAFLLKAEVGKAEAHHEH